MSDRSPMFEDCDQEAVVTDVSSDEIEPRGEEVPKEKQERGCANEKGVKSERKTARTVHGGLRICRALAAYRVVHWFILSSAGAASSIRVDGTRQS